MSARTTDRRIRALMLFLRLNQRAMHRTEAHPQHQRAVRLMASIRTAYLGSPQEASAAMASSRIRRRSMLSMRR